MISESSGRRTFKTEAKHTKILEVSENWKMRTATLDHVSPATLLLEKRRQMLEVQQALDAQKEESHHFS